MDRHHDMLAEYVLSEKNVHTVLSAMVSEPVVESRLLASGDACVSDGRQWWQSGTCGLHVTLHWKSLSVWPGALGGPCWMWFGFGHSSAHCGCRRAREESHVGGWKKRKRPAYLSTMGFKHSVNVT